MSIFQIKELWGTRVGANEEYDKNSVCLDSYGGDVKIIIGSFEGYLRVYKPKSKEFTASDMILERNMMLPILQVSCGAYHSSGDACLAILHSRKLVVAQILYTGKDLAQYKPLYEYSFDRNAFNLVSGNFGKS